ncbi:MAG: integrase arm-type DNA-binding domain-containing protein [Acuticoccus sp.]
MTDPVAASMVAAMKLTFLAIQNAKPKGKPYKLGDGENLYLTVTPNGAKSWRMNYSWLGRQKTIGFGRWPTVTLAEAREQKLAARKQLASGLDPAEQKRLAEMRALLDAQNSFRAVAEEWVEKNRREGRAPVTLEKIEWILRMAYPMMGERPIAQITAQELLLVLKKVEATGRYETARRMRSVIGRVFRYGIATGRAERDIASDLRGALITPRSQHLAAITTADEAGSLMRAIEGFMGSALTLYALRLSAHLFVRPGELRKAEWSEIDFGKSIWSIPETKMKMRRAHKVPLSDQVCTMIEELHDLSGHSPYLFPSFRTWTRPMSENTVNGALRRLGYSQDEMTAHGFRAMAATLLNEMGLWNADAIERQLGHLEHDGVRRAYVRGEHWAERVNMMQHWSNYLIELRDGARVVKPRFARG